MNEGRKQKWGVHICIFVSVMVLTFLSVFRNQRTSAFLLTYVVYRGLGLYGTSMSDIVLLQASIYIAVDMLPVPGAQGITEAMYRVVFGNVFSGQLLVASMCITRGISFYLVIMISFAVWGVRMVKQQKV